MSKFWGLVLKNGARYAQKVTAGFCISMAVLETEAGDSSGAAVKLVLEHDNSKFILCVLSAKNPQVPIRVKFAKGETVALRFQGGSASQKLHLTGYMLSDSEAGSAPFKGQSQSILVTEGKSVQMTNDKKRVSIKETADANRDASPSEDDEDEDLMDDDDLIITKAKPGGMNGSLEDEEDDEEEDDDDDDESDSDDEEEVKVVKSNANQTKKPTEKSPNNKSLKKMEDSDDDEDDDDDDSDEDESDDSDEDAPVEQKMQQQQRSPGTPTKKQDATAVMKTPENQNLKLKTPSSAGHTPMKMFTKGGVVCQELKPGGGPPAKSGKMVSVYYSGRLKSNNKVFDSNERGPGFKFRLGKGEVIRGWDLGVEGMKVGGKRRLTIPANLAYGKRGAPPDIPPNSTLVFEVELKNVS